MLLRNSYIGSTMMMKADIYEQENDQDPETGVINRHWELKKTVNCQVQAAKTSNTGGQAQDGKKYHSDNSYSEFFILRAKFLIPLSKRWRVGSIRSANNEYIYTENDTLADTPSIFEVVACHAMTDPFGKLSHYDVTLERVNVQEND